MEQDYKYKIEDRDYFYSKFQDFLNDEVKILSENIQIYPSRFIPSLQKFLNNEIKRGNIKGIPEEDIENLAHILYKYIIKTYSD